jgi:hypothetical protein
MFPAAFCGVLFRMRRVHCAVAIAAAGLLTACGAVAARPTAAGSPSPVAVPPSPPAVTTPGSPGGVPLHTPPTNGPRAVVVSEQDNAHAVSLRVGDRLELVLSSTYWQVEGSSDSGVLRQTIQPTVSPEARGCVVGGGCGTVTALYQALAPGRADLNARRTSCGEAMSCAGNLGSYRVTVLVTA